MSGAGDWGTDKARNRLQKDTPGQNKVGENKMEPTIKIDGRTKAFKEKVAKLAYEKAKELKAATSDNPNPLKGYPYNERMTKEHSEELMAFVKNAKEAGVEPTELMDAVENWMAIKGYKNTQEGMKFKFKGKKAETLFKKVAEELDEGTNDVVNALKTLVKQGGYDKKDYQKAHDLYKAGKLDDLRKLVYGLDTDPSETIGGTIAHHDPKTFSKMYPKAKGGDYIRSIIIQHGESVEYVSEDWRKDMERAVDDANARIAKAEKELEAAKKKKAELRAKRESKDMQSFSQFNEAKVTMAKLKAGMTFDVIHSGRSARNFGVNGQNVYGGKVKVLGVGNVPYGKKAEKKHVFARDMKDAQNKFRDVWNQEEIRYGYFGSSLGRIKAFFNAIAAESEGKKIPYGHTCWIWEVIEGENKGFISYCFISYDEAWEVVFLNKATEFQLIS